MFSLFLSTVKEKRMAIFYYGIAGLALILLYVGVYPSIQAQEQTIAKLLQTYPPVFLKAFNIQGNGGFSTLASYLSTEDYGLIWPLLSMFLTVSLASSLIAGEIENGSIGLLLSQPLSRTKIYMAKYSAAAIVLIAFVVVSVPTVSPIAAAFSLHIDAARVMELTGMGLLLDLAVLSLAFFFSSLFSEKGRVNATLGSILALMYVLNLVAKLNIHFSGLKYASFFYYFNPSSVLETGNTGHWSVLVFSCTALLFSILGLAKFNRRDISV